MLRSVTEENTKQLLRQHLYDPAYIDFLLQLLLIPTAESEGSTRADAPLPPPPSTSDETWDLATELRELLAVQKVHLCSGFFFSFLLRLKEVLLEPHLNGERSWLTAILQASKRHAMTL